MKSKLQIRLDQISAHFPAITPTNAQLLTQNGQFSDVVIVDNALVFRFPRSPASAAEMAHEIPVLEALQGQLPLPIPEPKFVARDATKGNLLFMGYPLIPGQSLLRPTFQRIQDAPIEQTLAEELAEFLRVLHGLPLDQIPSQTVWEDPRDSWKQTLHEFQTKLFPHMQPAARQAVTDLFEKALGNTALWEFEPVVHHGDFGTGNILFDAGHITGIIDFTFCAPGDPAQDAGALLASYGRDFLDHVCNAYPALRATLPRVEFITSTYALYGALYALRENNQAEFDECMQNYVRSRVLITRHSMDSIANAG